MTKRLKGKGGFTLLELIMVVIIIGILATLAVPQYTGFVERARAAEALNTIGAMKTAEDMVHLETGDYISDALGDGAGLPMTFPVAGAAFYWTYGVAVGGDAETQYSITATRTAKNAAGHTDETIVFTWDDALAPPEGWEGTYTEVLPR